MGGAHDREMSAVQGGDACCAEAFGDCDQVGVCAVKGHVLVAVDEFTNALPIRCGERLDGESTVIDCVEPSRWHGPEEASDLGIERQRRLNVARMTDARKHSELRARDGGVERLSDTEG